MKRLLFLCLLMPVFVCGQDSLNVRKILEKSIHTMDLKYKTLEYKIRFKSNDTVSNYRYSKIISDTAGGIRKIFLDDYYYKYDGKKLEVDLHYIFYGDRDLDTAYQWQDSFNILRVANYENADSFRGALGVKDYNYFTEMQNNFKDILVPAKAVDSMTRISSKKMLIPMKDSSLTVKGVVLINGKPHYLIERITIYTSEFWVEIFSYSKNEYVTLMPELCYNYYFIDTTHYMVNKTTKFIISTQGDTASFEEEELLYYKLNSFSEIKGANQNFKANKIIQIKNGREFVVKDLQGKAPEIKGTDTTGKAFSLHNQKANCFVLDFMFVGCIPCINALSVWEEISAKYPNNIKYFVINPLDKMDEIKKFIQKHAVTLPVIAASLANKSYAVSSYPTFYILDKDFNIIFSGSSVKKNREEIEKILSSYQ